MSLKIKKITWNKIIGWVLKKVLQIPNMYTGMLNLYAENCMRCMRIAKNVHHNNL